MRRLILVLVLACLAACAPRAIPGSHVNGASVVALVRPQLGVDGDGIEPTAPRFVPFCNAFAVIDAGEVRLITAEHCAPGEQPVRFWNPDGVGLGTAELETRDAVRDIARLVPRDAAGFAPLSVGEPPSIGAPVTTVSAVLNATLRGTLTDHYSGGFYGTDQRIEPGWSGSPVLDETGRVWGVIVSCPIVQASAAEGDFACVFGAIASALKTEGPRP